MDRSYEYKRVKMVEFGDMVRRLRAEKGMSASALGKKAHLTLVTVLRVENATIETLRTDTLLKLSKTLKFDPNEYMDLTKK